MPTPAETTAAQLDAARAALAEAEAAHAAAISAAAEPRQPSTVLIDIFTEIVGRLGNRPALEALLSEFKAAIAAAEGEHRA